jgi:hypothetical protein
MMKQNKNTDIWNKLSKYLRDKYKDFVIESFDGCFSYSVPQPWDKIIADLIKVIESHVTYKGTNIKIAQVKSKFGVLRFYVDGDTDDYIRGAIKMAELQSEKICPHCGSFDKPKVSTGKYLKGCISCGDNARFEMT